MADPPTLSSTGTGRTLGRRGEPAGSRAPLPATLKKATATLAALGVHERFAACIAHELRAPIALQRALIEVALANPTADTTSLRAMGERVLASCERQQRLIEALLTFARNPCALARHEPIDLATIAGAALQAHRPCELSCVATLEPAWTIGDPDLVERLTANLVGNAIDHNVPTGRIEVATATAAHCAVLSLRTADRRSPPKNSRARSSPSTGFRHTGDPSPTVSDWVLQSSTPSPAHTGRRSRPGHDPRAACASS